MIKILLILLIMFSSFGFAREVEYQDIEVIGEIVCVKGEKAGYTGLVREYYSNGNIKEEVEYKEGYKNGYSKEYSRDGYLKEESEYKKGKVDGVRKLYYDSGKLQIYQEWKNDELNGKSKHYYENGNLSYESTDVNGKKEGIIKFYYENGNIENEIEMKKGMKNGKYVYYFPNGKVKTEGEYKNDKEVGIWRDYTIDGSINREKKYEAKPEKEVKKDEIELEYNRNNSKYYKKGEKDPYTGKKINYGNDGKIQSIATYEEGNFNSEIFYDDYEKNIKNMEWFKKDEISENILYAQGIKVHYSIQNTKESYGEDRNYFYDTGKLKKVERYIGIYMKDRKPHGIQEEYYENGNLKEKVEYRNGILNGIYEKYGKDGKLQIKGEYKNGKKIGNWGEE